MNNFREFRQSIDMSKALGNSLLLFWGKYGHRGSETFFAAMAGIKVDFMFKNLPIFHLEHFTPSGIFFLNALMLFPKQLKFYSKVEGPNALDLKDRLIGP